MSLPTREQVRLGISLTSGLVAVAFVYIAGNDFRQSVTIGVVGQGRMWFAIAIACIAAALSILSFLFRKNGMSPMTRFTIGSLIVMLVSGGSIFYQSMPP